MVYFNIFSALLISFFFVLTLGQSSNVNTKDYIVYMGSISNKYSVSNEHINILQQVVEGRSAQETIIRSYKRSFSGFSARLTEKEYEKLKNVKEVVSVFLSRTLQTHTTRSWDFLGMPAEPSLKEIDAQSDIIIGVIDTGIWPELPSFNDDGLGPVPQKWKGGCYGGQNFTCNKKIIGARGYSENSGSARDNVGHGTHTASIAAGRKVEGANFYDIVKGTARGGVPSARIAVYTACDFRGCNDSDILAAFDDAIADGVDVITISAGGQPAEFYRDVVAIGAFHAMVKGVLTVQSVGNNGDGFTLPLGSVAPWILSVAASTIDRRIISKIILGNGHQLIGDSVNTYTMEGDKYPLVRGKGATSSCDEADAKECLKRCLDANLVKGKILVCDSAEVETAMKFGVAGVLGMTYASNTSFVFPLPGAEIEEMEFGVLESYLNSTTAPVADILKSESTNDTSAPVVAFISCRGPNIIASDILKPDISAPGVDILAAYSPQAPVSDYDVVDKRSVTYNVLTGTSMACPHVAAAAAFVKSSHPDWSPAAIKSALMTTAGPMNPSLNPDPDSAYPDTEFAYGSGHLNPYKATDPGLVYDAAENDYLTFLCKLGYDEQKIQIIIGNKNITCPKMPDQFPKDVNYPSMSAAVDANKTFTVSFNRTVTNVGKLNSTYRARVISDPAINVTVKPETLFFKSLKESVSFQVTAVGQGLKDGTQVSATVVWSDGFYNARSPIVIYTIKKAKQKREIEN